MSSEQNAGRSDMEKIVARAIEDEDFRKRLGEDPEAAVKAEGYTLSAEEMAAVKQNVDPDLSQEQLEERVSKSPMNYPLRFPTSGDGNLTGPIAPSRVRRSPVSPPTTAP